MPKLHSQLQEVQEWTESDQDALMVIVQNNPLIKKWLLHTEASIVLQTVASPLDMDMRVEALAMDRAYNTGRIEVILDLVHSAGIGSEKDRASIESS